MQGRREPVLQHAEQHSVGPVGPRFATGAVQECDACPQGLCRICPVEGLQAVLPHALHQGSDGVGPGVRSTAALREHEAPEALLLAKNEFVAATVPGEGLAVLDVVGEALDDVLDGQRGGDPHPGALPIAIEVRDDAETFLGEGVALGHGCRGARAQLKVARCTATHRETVRVRKREVAAGLGRVDAALEGDPGTAGDVAPALACPAERPPVWHTFPQEAGGPPLLDFTQTMKDDAAAQEHVVDLLGTLLDKTIQRNDMLGRKSELADFEAGKPCPLTASAYLKRIMKYGGCSPCCVVVGLMYLQRLKQRMPTVCLTSGNMQRLLLTSVMVAAKFLDDLYYSNKHWARIGGLNLQDVNALELKLLFQLSFAVGVTREEYQEYLQGLVGAGNMLAPPQMLAAPGVAMEH